MRWLDGITSSWSWWWIGKPAVLQSLLLQRVEPNWGTEMNWIKFISGRVTNKIYYLLWEKMEWRILRVEEMLNRIIQQSQNIFINDKFKDATLISVPIFCQSIHVTGSGRYHLSSQYIFQKAFCYNTLANIRVSPHMNTDMKELNGTKLFFVVIFKPWINIFSISVMFWPYDNHEDAGVCFLLILSYFSIQDDFVRPFFSMCVCSLVENANESFK